jgi:hypothetical protein
MKHTALKILALVTVALAAICACFFRLSPLSASASLSS